MNDWASVYNERPVLGKMALYLQEFSSAFITGRKQVYCERSQHPLRRLRRRRGPVWQHLHTATSSFQRHCVRCISPRVTACWVSIVGLEETGKTTATWQTLSAIRRRCWSWWSGRTTVGALTAARLVSTRPRASLTVCACQILCWKVHYLKYSLK